MNSMNGPTHTANESGRSCKSVRRTIFLRKSVSIQTLSNCPRAFVAPKRSEAPWFALASEKRRTRAQLQRLWLGSRAASQTVQMHSASPDRVTVKGITDSDVD